MVISDGRKVFLLLFFKWLCLCLSMKQLPVLMLYTRSECYRVIMSTLVRQRVIMTVIYWDRLLIHRAANFPLFSWFPQVLLLTTSDTRASRFSMICPKTLIFCLVLGCFFCFWPPLPAYRNEMSMEGVLFYMTHNCCFSYWRCCTGGWSDCRSWNW